MQHCQRLVRSAIGVLAFLTLCSLIALTAEHPLRVTTVNGNSNYDWQQTPPARITVAVVTGGHDFDTSAFLQLFEKDPGVTYTHLPQADESEAFEDISRWPYDVIVLYTLTQTISTKRRENLLRLLDDGVGVLSLHHASGAFQKWQEFPKIIGCRYFLSAVDVEGTHWKPSSYRHDVEIPVHVEDSSHPVTRGVKDFFVNDETYKGCAFEPGNRVLLSTAEPSSDQPLGWVRTYRRSNVCHFQLGHGSSIFSSEQFRRLVRQGLRWCAQPRLEQGRREPPPSGSGQ